MDDEIVRQLKGAGCGEVRFDPLTRQIYSTDASHYRVVPHGVVLPAYPFQVGESLHVGVKALADLGGG